MAAKVGLKGGIKRLKTREKESKRPFTTKIALVYPIPTLHSQHKARRRAIAAELSEPIATL